MTNAWATQNTPSIRRERHQLRDQPIAGTATGTAMHEASHCDGRLLKEVMGLKCTEGVYNTSSTARFTGGRRTLQGSLAGPHLDSILVVGALLVVHEGHKCGA